MNEDEARLWDFGPDDLEISSADHSIHLTVAVSQSDDDDEDDEDEE